MGRSFEELACIIEGVAAKCPELSDKLGVCLDTCHVSDAGYDIIHDLDGVLDEFDRVVGIDRLHAVHINDSKNPCGAIKIVTSASARDTLAARNLAAVCRLCRLLYRIAACAHCHLFWRRRTNLQVMQRKLRY